MPTILGKASCPHPHGHLCCSHGASPGKPHLPACTLLPQCAPSDVSLTSHTEARVCAQCHGSKALAQASSTASLPVRNSLMQRRGFKVHVNMPTCNVHQVCTTRSGSHTVCTAWSHTQTLAPLAIGTPSFSLLQGLQQSVGSSGILFLHLSPARGGLTRRSCQSLHTKMLT